MLGKLSAALELSVSELLAAPGSAAALAGAAQEPAPCGSRPQGGVVRRAGAAPERRDPDTGYVRRQVSTPRFPAAVTEVTLPPGARVPYPAGAYAFIAQLVWVLSGQITLRDGPAEHVLGAGDAFELGEPRPREFPQRRRRRLPVRRRRYPHGEPLTPRPAAGGPAGPGPAVVAAWCNRLVLETPEETGRLQELLDRSAAAAGPHLRDIITGERRLSAAALRERLQGMRLLVVATVTADGRPLAGPVDGYFLHGSFYFGSGRNSVRMRHLAARPAVSATHLPGEQLAVTVHGRAELFDLSSPAGRELRQAMLDHYLPVQGAEFETWLDESGSVAARIDADKMFTFAAAG